MSSKIYGIDLGTTYSCIAVVDEHGKPAVIPNLENDLTTPSVVYFENDENVVVGKAAKDIAEMYPDQVVSMVKRVMGDEAWTYDHEGHTYTPQEISALILRKLVDDAERNTGEEIKDVVITVPAYFGVNQKEAAKQAGELADLTVHYVIPEPTAAAISYGMENGEDQVILVYDLGGGTFDITVIEISDGGITVIATGGDHQLGGRNWDETLAGYLAQCFEEETGTSAEDLLNDPETWQELLNSAEKCKRDLTSRESVKERISYEGERITIELTREKFEELTSGLIERTISMTEELLDTVNAKGYSKIDKLLLVGGSTYMPQVTRELSQKFSFEITSHDPNQAVAKGAAIFGRKYSLEEDIRKLIANETGQSVDDIDISDTDDEILEEAQKTVAENEGISLPGLKRLTDTSIINVTSKSFGIVVLDSNEEEKVNNLIIVDDQVPATISKTFPTAYEGQDGAELKCVESIERIGTDELFDLDETQIIGKAELEFDRALPVGSPVEITFSLAPDGLLSVHAKDLTTDREINAQFETESILSHEEVEEKKEHQKALRIS